MTIGEKIRHLRVLKGYSQENMAELIGISPTAYGNIERNGTDISLSRLEQIAKTLEVNVLDILSFGERIFNYFNGQKKAIGVIYGGDSTDKNLTHEIEKLKLEIDKKEIFIEKLSIEVTYWREKYEASRP